MKSTLFAIAVIGIMIGSSTPELIAQPSWGGCSSSCSEQGSCGYRADSRALVPYGRSPGYAYQRAPYQANYGHPGTARYPSGDCGYSGNCDRNRFVSHSDGRYAAASHSCPGGRCPYERTQANEWSGTSLRNSPSGPGPNPGYGNRERGYSNGQYYSTPAQRQPESFPQSPADQRPRLTAPLFTPPSGFIPDNSRSGSGELQMAPPTSTLTMPPPQLSPRTSFGSQTRPQLLPPAGNRRQRSSDEHADHDHSGHDHAGCNHNH